MREFKIKIGNKWGCFYGINFFNLPSGIISCFENSKILSYFMETIKGRKYKKIFSLSLRTLKMQVLREIIFAISWILYLPSLK